MNKKDIRDLMEEVKKYREKSILGGGVEKIEKQREKGKLWVRDRIQKLLDPGSFEELQWMRIHRSTYFGLDKIKYYGDGVVVGYGRIDGRLVYIYAQDFSVMGGSIGESHADKIVRIINMAIETGAPVIGLYDSGGARIQEGVASLHGSGRIFAANVKASGVIPQISLILGPCAGAASYSPALTDFIIMVKNAFMFITGPEVVKAATGVETTFTELGGAHIHSATSGVAHFVTDDEDSAFQLTRKLLSYLPNSFDEDPPYVKTSDPIDRRIDELYEIVPTDPMKPFDVREVIMRIVDDGDFLEVHRDYARSAVVGFGRIGGHTVGIVANQPMVNAGVIDIDASNKIARFVRFCDSFNIPVITFVDTPGFMPGIDQEHGGIIRHGAKILYAYAEATVPIITVIMRKAYGGAYIAMGSRSLGADIVYAWPTAEIAVMGPEGAVRILYRKEAAKQPNPKEYLEKKLVEYRKIFANPYRAAELGYVDDIIDPALTRLKIYKALEALKAKKEEMLHIVPRKHGNIPL
ncbi:propionyl-CoA carboxylase carboxyltransferase subunit alpha / propionyl-CoA carboxylase carboxyltransferase subunit beta [Staphylothermus marinus F1]|uniref:Propionyl-CoA carboxylase carboxyltransferase subunit alpha / propionyl-CoA carboxylase carboxyltransferase subunit beta n=2 Tax=Staphylothermus marinus TaxID=2280 RepID=A3DPF6_STAMF|nr:propionyl-CoA carboxylase carboxyltransferase subunit alpha / propionyl-CoA carboxylase carboxyltransferase subunit beta [Staphylothermus marinus F1]